MRHIELGVLDLTCKSRQETFLDSVNESIELARMSEELGYSRYWIAEHHADDSSQCSPETFVGMLAERTRRIRVGSGGVLLRYREPYFVAQAFSLLSALHPGRIDLGIARGSVAVSLNDRLFEINTSTSRLEEKCALLTRLFHEGSKLPALRPGSSSPDVWMLGGRGAMISAALHQMNFCLDCFFTSLSDAEIRDVISEYATRFKEVSESRQPEFAVAVAGICAETDERAEQHLNASSKTGFPLGTIKPVLVGSVRRWCEYLRDAQEKWRVDRFIILNASYDFNVRRSSLRLIAEKLLRHQQT